MLKSDEGTEAGRAHEVWHNRGCIIYRSVTVIARDRELRYQEEAPGAEHLTRLQRLGARWNCGIEASSPI